MKNTKFYTILAVVVTAQLLPPVLAVLIGIVLLGYAYYYINEE
jgi:hypothetical protein